MSIQDILVASQLHFKVKVESVAVWEATASLCGVLAAFPRGTPVNYGPYRAVKQLWISRESSMPVFICIDFDRIAILPDARDDLDDYPRFARRG